MSKLIKNRSQRSRNYIPKLSVGIRLLLYIITIFVGTASILAAMDILSMVPETVIYIIYGCAGALLVIAAYYFYLDCRSIKHSITKWINKYSVLNRLLEDYRYRTMVFAGAAFICNILFAVYNGSIGIVNHSIRFGTMGVYYILLSCMRFWIIRYEIRERGKLESEKEYIKEIDIIKNCGIMLLIMTVALGIVVAMTANRIGVKKYFGVMIFAVAAYTFYKIIIACVHIVKVRKMNSILLIVTRNIGYADALVSVMLLQSAMIVSFGDPEGTFAENMNIITGMAVCIMIIILGIYMIWFAGKKRKEILS